MLIAYVLSLYLLPWASPVFALDPAAVAVCLALHKAYPAITAWDPNSILGWQSMANAGIYNNALAEYWNSINGDQRPTCAFFPSNAQQVSTAVKQLNKYPRAKFALKSGGHNFNVGFSSTAEGVLISFNENLSGTVRTPDGEAFEVGPGARWGDVYNVTAKTNQVVVGGRLGNIGVGGFVLGGGLSYYSAQYGLSCDNVLNFEVVLGDGRIVNANSTSNPDLWWALKGGGNRFGIVTKMTLKAHPLGVDGQVWGGIRLYSTERRAEIFSTLSTLIENYPDPKAAVIPTFSIALLDSVMLFFYYDGPSPPAGAFAGLEDIPPMIDLTKQTTYPEMTSLAGGGAMAGYSTAAHVNTFPNLEPTKMGELLESIWGTYKAKAKNDDSRDIKFSTATFATQPLPATIAQIGVANGGNALGLNPVHGDLFWVENTMLWEDAVCNEACPEVLRDIGDTALANYKSKYSGTKPTHYQSGDLDWVALNPLFMNDAADYQDVYSSYGKTNKAKLIRIAKKYDPQGFMKRQGGWILE